MLLQTYLRLSARHVISAQVSTTSLCIIIIIYKPSNSKLSLNKQDNYIMVNVLMKCMFSYQEISNFFLYIIGFHDVTYGQQFRTFELSTYVL